MIPEKIFDELHRNKNVFQELLSNISKENVLWSQNPKKWCLLEVVCHLYDEEREDFRTRVKCVLADPETPPPSFDPLIWVKERNYKDQGYDLVLFDGVAFASPKVDISDSVITYLKDMKQQGQ